MIGSRKKYLYRMTIKSPILFSLIIIISIRLTTNYFGVEIIVQEIDSMTNINIEKFIARNYKL